MARRGRLVLRVRPEFKGQQDRLGPRGRKKLPGPFGPAGATGATGAAGATGAQGLQGVAGPQGLQGATGPQGPMGVGGGTNFSGCTKVIDSTVVYQGAWTCMSALPHYVDNGDGTVTDSRTGLMWEEQTESCTGEITCVNDRYLWSTGDNNPDGTLYTTFLSGLNGQSLFGGSENCFAGYCDWRIPTINELRSLVSMGPPNCASGPCTDMLGGTRNAPYWSSSSLASDAGSVWLVDFRDGSVFSASKDNGNAPAEVRAVRGGR